MAVEVGNDSCKYVRKPENRISLDMDATNNIMYLANYTIAIMLEGRVRQLAI